MLCHRSSLPDSVVFLSMSLLHGVAKVLLQCVTVARMQSTRRVLVILFSPP